ncbi:hypothetical protein O181_007236 [Austropuccinia psidii MF-1]|uniref:Uncharacterized protein n=1 Tax=Austropuccinia psidii MF-1 TaxID=1389203 RepID=A0A9Q3BKG6_9BASI|nr:hypothetical protein [Austropuccinia psidii MF-1]
MENYLLETTTRTNFLRTRTLTHFRPALRRRLEFELARITPSIANVTALDYHQRDNGILRRTMEFVARLAIEQKGIEIGIKRSQSQETAWDDLQKNHHKRKRALNSTAESTSSKSGQPSYPGQSEEVDPTSLTSSSKPRRPSQRSKPPTSNSAHSLLSQSHSKSSFAPTDLNPRLPSTPSMSEFKPVRLARRNESLLSVNDLFPRVPSQGEIFGGGQKIEFTFVEKSKWRELEDKLKGLDMKENASVLNHEREIRYHNMKLTSAFNHFFHFEYQGIVKLQVMERTRQSSGSSAHSRFFS